MTDVESRLRGSFARQTMMQTLGATMEEAADLLEWLTEDNFIFLGLRQ